MKYLADIAAMYFVEGLTQAEIAKKVGVTRSMISYLIKESRDSGIVQITINQPIQENEELEKRMQDAFDLMRVVVVDSLSGTKVLPMIGKAASEVLIDELEPGDTLGTSWGSSISATVDALDPKTYIPDLTIVQLLGALSGRLKEYDAHHHLQQLVSKLGGIGLYLNAPLVVEDNHFAKTLMQSRGIQDTLQAGSHSNVALLGVGSVTTEESPYFHTGYFSEREIKEMQSGGTVGDVCGHFFNIKGEPTAGEFASKIPQRLGIAGGPYKVKPIIGALKGGYVNILVTDSNTAESILMEINQHA